MWLLSSLFATEKQYASNIESWELGQSSDESPRRTKELFRRQTCFRVGGEIALKGAREDELATTLGDAAGIVDMIPSLRSGRASIVKKQEMQIWSMQ